MSWTYFHKPLEDARFREHPHKKHISGIAADSKSKRDATPPPRVLLRSVGSNKHDAT